MKIIFTNKNVYYQRKLLYNHSGDDSIEDPPVPIPNTEVKLYYVESTCRATDREDRKLPDFKKKASTNVGAFLFERTIPLCANVVRQVLPAVA